MTDGYYDGDSFRVQHEGRVHVVRLYAADTPETNSSLGKRIEEQAAYFQVKPEDILRAGAEAKEFTAKFLSKPFVVVTRRKVAPGASRLERIYGVVERDGVSLDGALIEAGLARASFQSVDKPDAAAGRQHALKLRAIETKARHARRGLWARSAPKLSFRNLKERLLPRFFKPAGSPASRFINLNTASAAELEALPGFGAKTAQQIIRARPLKDLSALDALPGMGPKKIEVLRDLVSF